MAACSSTTEQKTPRLSRRRESLAKKPSTALSQELEVGVKWKVQRGWRASRRRISRLVSGIVVEDRVHELAGGDLALERVQDRMNS